MFLACRHGQMVRVLFNYSAKVESPAGSIYYAFEQDALSSFV